MKTSRIEIQHLFRAWIVISAAFAIAFTGFSLTSEFLAAVIIAGITVGLGFLLHEMAHKIVAQRFGCFAEFRANNHMLILALILSFTGIVFAAPGAVIISGGRITRRNNGLISVAGPATNIIIALFFLNFKFVPSGMIGMVGHYGFLVNSWLALFNMIPFGMFDGAKVLRWNKPVYAFVVAIALILVFFQGFF